MKLLLLLLPLLGMLTLAQTVHNEECHCPEVKCAADDPVVGTCHAITMEVPTRY